MTTIFVTGGAGYVGSHCCKALAARGYLPVAYDSLARGHRDAVKWGPLAIGDITDEARLTAALAEYRPAAVLHLAALADVSESVAEPLAFYRSNIGGTIALVRSMVGLGLKGLVFSSTCAVYGPPLQTPIAEDHPLAPNNPYGYSKQVGERVLADAGLAHGLRSVVLRYFNAAGADPAAEIGERHSPETHLIPSLLEVAAELRPRLSVFGTDHPTPDGTCLRDYVHVCDLADAHLRALDWLLAGGESLCLNIGSGRAHSVMEVVQAARAITGRPIEVDFCPRRAGDVPMLLSDPSKAFRLLGWRASHSLESQIGDAWRWHQCDYRTTRRLA